MEKPLWKLTRFLPKHLNRAAIENAVSQFVMETQKYCPGIDPKGFYNQTISKIAAACIQTHDGSGGDFWAAIGDDGDVYAYALAHIVIDIDNRPTYWVTQGWVHSQYRDGINLKRGWEKLEEYARVNVCSHIINVTDRHAGAYLRVLGKEWHPYATLLKKDLN